MTQCTRLWVLRVLSLWDRFWGIKRFFILYCVAVRPDLGNAVPQTKSTGHSFALDSYQDVGFSLCFLQQQGQEFMALQGEMERAQLCPLLRDLSPRLPSTPVSGDVCCSQRQVLWLWLQCEGDVSIRNAKRAKWTSTACWCTMKRFPSCLAVCVAFQCQVHTTASDVSSCCLHVCHAVSQQHSPCTSSLPGGEKAA